MRMSHFEKSAVTNGFNFVISVLILNLLNENVSTSMNSLVILKNILQKSIMKIID